VTFVDMNWVFIYWRLFRGNVPRCWHVKVIDRCCLQPILWTQRQLHQWTGVVSMAVYDASCTGRYCITDI